MGVLRGPENADDARLLLGAVTGPSDAHGARPRSARGPKDMLIMSTRSPGRLLADTVLGEDPLRRKSLAVGF